MIILAVLLAFVACTGKEIETSDKEGNVKEENNKEGTMDTDDDWSQSILEDVLDVQPVISDKMFQLPMYVRDFEALGWKYPGNSKNDKMFGNTTVYGVDFTKDDMSVVCAITNATDDIVYVSDCQVTSVEISWYGVNKLEVDIPFGLQLGKTTCDDVIAEYGEPVQKPNNSKINTVKYEYDENVRFNGNSISLEFSDILHDDGKEELTGLIVTANDVLEEESDYGVIETKEYIYHYEVPTELSTDLFDMTFELDGDIYQFPLPLSVLKENGFWTPTFYVLPDAEEGQTLDKGDSIYSCRITNFTDIIRTDIFVTQISAYNFNSQSAADMIVSGNIQGDVTTEEELLAFLERYEYEIVYEHGSHRTYAVSNANVQEDCIKRYDFYVRDGMVVDICITCTQAPGFE